MYAVDVSPQRLILAVWIRQRRLVLRHLLLLLLERQLWLLRLLAAVRVVVAQHASCRGLGARQGSGARWHKVPLLVHPLILHGVLL
jgi:hypothetical protein